MKTFLNNDRKLHEDLASIYEEVMWLAERPNTTAAAARSWYTHVASVRLRRQVRRFTGEVSEAAARSDENAPLQLEHPECIQTKLTQLVARHKAATSDVEEFIRIIIECEKVRIVTTKENYDLRKASGDYVRAGIRLVLWQDIPVERRRVLWRKLLNGRVSNDADFAPPRTISDIAGKYRANDTQEAKDHDGSFAAAAGD
jgi:hypothetical protein